MKCPSCGADTDKSKPYCQSCGAQLFPRDNSADKTLRLPDLSRVGDVNEPVRRKSAPSRKQSGGGKTAAIICAVIAIIAVAVCLAVLASRVYTPPTQQPESDIVNNEDTNYIPAEDEPDFDIPDDPAEEEPAVEDKELEDKEEPEIIVDDVTPEPEQKPEEEPAPEETPEEVPAEEPGGEPEAADSGEGNQNTSVSDSGE